MSAQVTRLAVCGLHLRKQPLNHQLTDLGAKFVKECWSSPHYQLFALPAKNGKPAKPGMIYDPKGGSKVFLEVWELEVSKLGFFVIQVPAPLAIGTVHLEDGDSCLGFIAEGFVGTDKENTDITSYGSWLEYKKSL